MTNVSNKIALEDIKKIKIVLDNGYLCSCKELKNSGKDGSCLKHGLLFISKEQHKAIEKLLGMKNEKNKSKYI